MIETITGSELKQMFENAAALIREQSGALCALDSVAGDGDHGATMLRVVEQLASLPLQHATELGAAFRDAGWKILGTDGGASSSLLGMFFLGMADVPALGNSLDCLNLAKAFEAGLVAVAKQTSAKPGDKTLMDALAPAIAAVRTAANAGKSVAEGLSDAASAARAGAESTSALTARFGRARLLGEQTRGHRDPGAASIALLFEGFSTALLGPKGKFNA
jgi:phosphoenolpyruvate---glycerone phosphotransferase subunit DhaL